MEERLRQAAAAVLGAGCPSVAQTIEDVYCAPGAGVGSSGAASPRSRASPDCEQGVELAAVVTHDAHAAGPGPSSSGGSGAWDASLGLSSSGAWGYAPGLSSGAAEAGPSSSRAAGSSGSGSW